MTIDEAIARYKEKADFFENRFLSICAKEHKQVVEWLELLKWYQQGMEDIPTESGVLPKDVYMAGYIKGIDDFLKECKTEYDNDFCPNVSDCLDYKISIRDLCQIAQQLKDGDVE